MKGRKVVSVDYVHDEVRCFGCGRFCLDTTIDSAIGVCD
jgi:hypothetical protein